MSRNYVEEILSISRSKESRTAYYNLTGLTGVFSDVSKLPLETLKYIPVTLVAHLEVYIRAAIKELVDHGEPYLSRSEKFKKSLDFNFTVIKALSEKTITLGDFIAHLLPISTLSHVDSHLSVLTDSKLLEDLKSITASKFTLENEIMNEEVSIVIPKPDETYAAIKKLFEIRHIIVHEVGPNDLIPQEEIPYYIEQMVSFVEAIDQVISKDLYPLGMLSQSEMNALAYESLSKSEENLNSLITRIADDIKSNSNSKHFYSSAFDRGNPKEAYKNFDKAHKAWLKYKKLYTGFLNSYYYSGTMWPAVIGGILETMTDNRTQELKNSFFDEYLSGSGYD